MEKELNSWPEISMKKKVYEKNEKSDRKDQLTNHIGSTLDSHVVPKFRRNHTLNIIPECQNTKKSSVFDIHPEDDKIKGVYRSKTLLVPVIDKKPKPEVGGFATMPLLLHPGYSGFALPEISSEKEDSDIDVELPSLHSLPVQINKPRRLSKIRHDSSLLFPKMQKLVDEYHGRSPPEGIEKKSHVATSPFSEKLVRENIYEELDDLRVKMMTKLTGTLTGW